MDSKKDIVKRWHKLISTKTMNRSMPLFQRVFLGGIMVLL